MKRRVATIGRFADSELPPAVVCRFLATTLCAACVLACACSTEPARPVLLGDDIRVGPYAFKVVRARTTPNPPPPISTFRPQAARRGIAVFVRWNTLDDSMDVMRRIAFVDSFLSNHLSIVDGDGKRTKPGGALQESLMYMQDPGPNWRDWVVVFHVLEKSQDLSLVIENPEPREDQARFTTMKLEM